MSLRLAGLNLVLRGVAKGRLRRTTDPQRARREFDLFARTILRSGRRLRITSEPARPPCPALWWHSAGPVPVPGLILYLHGGGYIAGSPRTHRGLIGALAAGTGLRVCAPSYRLAPEHPLPAALDDALAAWSALTASGHDRRAIVIGGDSAGGGLALALLAHLCQAGTPPAGVFVFSPWTDLTGSGASVRTNSAADAVLPAERLDDLVGFALGGHPARDPRVSPLFAFYPQCPPVLFQASDTEILRDDTLRLAERLSQEGAAVTVETWPDTPHAWQIFAGLLPEADIALKSVMVFAAGCLSGSRAPASIFRPAAPDGS